MAQTRFACKLIKADELPCPSYARVTIVDAQGGSARACPSHGIAALDGIAGAHVDWTDSKGLNEWEHKALELAEERSNFQLRGDAGGGLFRQVDQHRDQLRHHLGVNGIQLAASLVSSLAWPAAVVIILAIFRRPVTKLIGRATQYKGFGQEITFGEELAGVESKVQSFTDMRVEYLWLDNRTRYWTEAEKRRLERRRAAELTRGSVKEAEPKTAGERGILPAPDYSKLNQLIEIAQEHPSQAVLA